MASSPAEYVPLRVEYVVNVEILGMFFRRTILWNGWRAGIAVLSGILTAAAVNRCSLLAECLLDNAFCVDHLS
jgi:hypothetical protein